MLVLTMRGRNCNNKRTESSFVSEEKDIEDWWNNEPTIKILNRGIIKPWNDEGESVAYKIVSSQTANDNSENHDGFYLMFKGYGDAMSVDGHGAQIKVENEGGRIRILVWSNINDENYTHSIWLDEALESQRIPARSASELSELHYERMRQSQHATKTCETCGATVYTAKNKLCDLVTCEYRPHTYHHGDGTPK